MTESLVVYDTDPGIDDAMALLYLNALPQIQMLGITTTAGNASIEDCTRNALHICATFNIPVEVYQGTNVSISGAAPQMYPDFVHGSNGLGDIDFEDPPTNVSSQSAAAFIAEVVNARPGEVTLLAVGRLTNIALAFILEPTTITNGKDIVLMGGAYDVPGNVSAFAEANIAGDPEAAALVFSHQIPITMVGLDITMQTIMLPEVLDRLCQSSGQAGKFIKTIAPVYADYYAKSGWQGFPMHDSSAVAFVDQPELFTTVRGTLSCVTEGPERGRTLLTPDEAGLHQVCIGVDSAAMLTRYEQTLSAGY